MVGRDEMVPLISDARDRLNYVIIAHRIVHWGQIEVVCVAICDRRTMLTCVSSKDSHLAIAY